MAALSQRCARFVMPSLLQLASVNRAYHIISIASPHIQSFPSSTLSTDHHSSPLLPSHHFSSSSSPPDYNINLTPSQLNSLKSSCHLVDVRQPEELVNEVPMIPGAQNIPLGELGEVIDTLPQENVVFMCRGGVRSVVAVNMGLQAGMKQPRHLEGGMNAWSKEFTK